VCPGAPPGLSSRFCHTAAYGIEFVIPFTATRQTTVAVIDHEAMAGVRCAPQSVNSQHVRHRQTHVSDESRKGAPSPRGAIGRSYTVGTHDSHSWSSSAPEHHLERGASAMWHGGCENMPTPIESRWSRVTRHPAAVSCQNIISSARHHPPWPPSALRCSRSRRGRSQCRR
jgi:hypothetical protein